MRLQFSVGDSGGRLAQVSPCHNAPIYLEHGTRRSRPPIAVLQCQLHTRDVAIDVSAIEPAWLTLEHRGPRQGRGGLRLFNVQAGS